VRAAASLLDSLSFHASPTATVGSLRVGEQQLVEIAKALSLEARLLIMDEPTSALSVGDVERLHAIIRRLAGAGVAIVYISHRMEEIFDLAETVTVLRDGALAGTFDRDRTTPDTIVRAMVGREPPARIERPVPPAGTAPALSVEALSRPPWFRDVSLTVRSGEIVGVFGLVGSGRTELLETLFGLASPASGRVRVDGQPVTFGSAREATAAGFGFVPEDRQRLGLHFNLTICHNTALASAARAGLGAIDTRRETKTADALVASLAIRTRSIADLPDALSGGNQQKVVLAKWLATAPRILLLDEPTKGVDVGAKFEIHNLIRERAAAGMACLVVSSDLPEILALVDRIVVMREGVVRGELDAPTATEERVMQLATHEVAVSA
jgi:ABC-type sugar transport system ATPase subunit